MAKTTKKLALTPLADRVVVAPASKEEVSASGIIIPDTTKAEKPERGTVMAVGPGKVGDDNERIPMTVKVGDTVLFSKYGYDEVKIDGKEYFILSESSVLAVIND
ncbi:MAG TPA: co-chaperone GroES [Candidatus Paceibacterota bacterium]